MLGVAAWCPDLPSVDQREVWAGLAACVLTEVVKGPHVRSRDASLSPGLAELSIPGQCAGLGQVWS